jgi:hypothetical protein
LELEVTSIYIVIKTRDKSVTNQILGNEVLFFDKCSIDPEVRSIVHKYRAENGVHAYEKLAERCKQ